ncbi:ATP synthase subunit gamma, mitochondrial-like isoform X4 [Amaranthus tricolor]|uniref:ATP synthase subunit gamma, mitochondrial-like isoform X4 n=1 Tax=Amaranthus tricolor TaxID=29722 RepID=UPI002584A195|nr:ATP synthase subunit gamma, mitochondrial-like isoform X4 [Amaranthus tricolor]
MVSLIGSRHFWELDAFQLRLIRNRMKSVKNIQKITKAMKMVAASKLRQIQTKTENSRGLWQPFTALLGDTPSVDEKKNVVITISSDKGLCGGNNSTSVKTSRAIRKISDGPDKETKYVILGEKAKVQLIRDSRKDIELCITELQKNPLNYTQVAALADDILKNVQFDALRIVFNKFSSVVSFVPTMSTILSPEVQYLAVSKVQGCLPWIAQAEMLEICLFVSHLPITGHVKHQLPPNLLKSFLEHLLWIISGASALEG